MWHPRLTPLFALACMVACEHSQPSLSDSSAGDVSDDSSATFRAVNQPLNPDNFRKVVVAQQALDTVKLRADLPRVSLANPTDAQIERTVIALEAEPAARVAIERSGLSVRDFVLTSLALAQGLNFPARARTLLPPENVTFLDRNRTDVDRVRIERRVRVFDDDVRARDDDEDEDDDDRVEDRHRHGDDRFERGERDDDDHDHRGRGRGHERHGGDHGRHRGRG